MLYKNQIVDNINKKLVILEIPPKSGITNCMFKTIYKEKGLSSSKAIINFKRENNINKIGHTGTLDVLAQGLLLIATEEDTKLINYIENKNKEYKVIAKIGYTSKTFDSEGPIEFYSDSIPTKKEIEDVLNSFIGKIKQTPPSFSAKKIKGKRAYELAREDVEFKLKEIEVEIFSITDIKYEYPLVEFNALVSNGTYIRSLVNDLGIKLKTGAYMKFLERTMISGINKIREVKASELIKLNKIEIKNISELQNWFNGKIKTYKGKDGVYQLVFKEKIIGIVELKEERINYINLFGNKITSILNKEK